MPRVSGGHELRVAMVGYGLAGSTFHRPLIQAVPGPRLATVVTRDPGRQARVREEIPGVVVIDSAEAIWAAPPEHDLAVIVTPLRRWGRLSGRSGSR